jgi:hypothetical protein
VDPLDDEVDLIQPILMLFDIFVLEALQIELLQIITLLDGRLKLGIPQFVIESIEPLTLKQVIDPLTPLTAEVQGLIAGLLRDHHRFVEGKVAVGAGYLRQMGSLGSIMVST